MESNNNEANFNTNNIHSVSLNLQDGQVEIILRALELYGYNLEFMLNSTDSDDNQKQKKTALLKFTYEQVLSSQAEQIQTKANNIDKLNEFGKLMLRNNDKNTNSADVAKENDSSERKLKVV